MPIPYYLYCELPAPRLYPLNDGRFQLLDNTPIPPFLAGYGYLLIEQSLADFLLEVGVARLRVEPAVLWDRTTGVERRTHVRLHVGQSFAASQLFDLALDGLQMLLMEDEYCFVSPELKSLLESSEFDYLRFSEGLSEFAA